MLLRWIFWILVVLWLFFKLKHLFENDKTQNQINDDIKKNNHTHENKILKNDAGEYVDFEEIK